MDRRTVELRIAGQSVRLVSSAPEDQLQRLAGMVEAKLGALGPRGRVQSQALLLAAMALAHEVETERGRREAVERRTRDLMRRVLVRIEDALEPLGSEGAERGSNLERQSTRAPTRMDHDHVSRETGDT